jgi:hypothetical protein
MFSQKHFSSKIALSGAAAAAIDLKRLTTTIAVIKLLNLVIGVVLAIILCGALFELLASDKCDPDAGASDACASDSGDSDMGASDAGDPDSCDPDTDASDVGELDMSFVRT